MWQTHPTIKAFLLVAVLVFSASLEAREVKSRRGLMFGNSFGSVRQVQRTLGRVSQFRAVTRTSEIVAFPTGFGQIGQAFGVESTEKSSPLFPSIGEQPSSNQLPTLGITSH